MASRTLSTLLLSLCLGCTVDLQQPTHEQRLPSGKTVLVTSCVLAWGVEHGERHAREDAFALEYVTSLLPSGPDQLDQEALEVFELIRPVSEQWSLNSASVSAFPSAERSGKYEIFAFSRGADGRWSPSRRSAKVFNTESGHKPGHS